MRFDYINASLEDLAQHFKTASRQLVHVTRERYKADFDILRKLDKAYIMAKIARLQDELRALEKQANLQSENG